MLLSPADAPQSFILDKDSHLIGRTDPHTGIFPEVDLSLFDPETKVSRRHARIYRQGQQFLIEDLSSVNGTTINGQIRLPPKQPRVLNAGDELKLGETTQMARACPKCRRELLERSKFCPNCGASIAALPAVVTTPSLPVADGVEAAAARPRVLAESAVTRPIVDATRAVSRETAPAGVYEPAGFALRFGALLFDLLVTMIAWMAFTFVLSYLSKKSVVSSNSMLASVYIVALGLFALNFVLLAGRTGQSLGKRILGIRIVRENGLPFGVGAAVTRHVAGYLLSAIGAFLGFAWILWDRKQQGWHDKLARTIVVLIK
jgi:uncharacterized RDD family membrane protein YckC